MASGVGEETVSNKQVVLKNYISGLPKESDMEVITGAIKLKLADGSKGVTVKNLYLSCDSFMSVLMGKGYGDDQITSFTRNHVRFNDLFLTIPKNLYLFIVS